MEPEISDYGNLLKESQCGRCLGQNLSKMFPRIQHQTQMLSGLSHSIGDFPHHCKPQNELQFFRKHMIEVSPEMCLLKVAFLDNKLHHYYFEFCSLCNFSGSPESVNHHISVFSELLKPSVNCSPTLILAGLLGCLIFHSEAH